MTDTTERHEVRSEEGEAPQGSKKLLFLCQNLPYPPDGGANIRSYNLLKILAEEFSITALCFVRKRIRPTPEAIAGSLAGMSAHGRTQAFPIPQENSNLRFIWDHLRSLVLGKVYTDFVYDSSAFRRQIRTILNRENIHLVHLDSLDLSPYVKDLNRVPVVCGHHNVESDLLETRANVESRWFKSWYLGHQARLMRGSERHFMPRMALNLACSPHDVDRLREIAPDATLTLVPNGVDTEAISPAYGGEGGLVFVGGHTWFPNSDGMRWFAEEILPSLRSSVPGLPVTWVGRATEQVRREFREKFEVEMTGYVEDIRPRVAEASVFVVPLRVGGGTRLKVLDAWAMGKAVVSTSVGCQGLAAKDGENIIIRDDPDSFSRAVLELLTDREYRQALEREGRRTAVEQYDWKAIGEHVRAEYRKLL